MEFKIPFTFSKLEKLKRKSEFFKSHIKSKKNSKLSKYLHDLDSDMNREEYLSICFRNFVISFIFSYVFLGVLLFVLKISLFYLYALIVSILFSIFIFLTQINYPRVYLNRKQRNIERNLIPALEDVLVQLNSGIPLFNILVNISYADYGELSKEFGKVSRKINAGSPQIEVIEELGEKNSSVYFRRALWQISNGMRAGSDISIIIKESVKSLNEEQLIQIQTYGNKLNPIIMFYMLISVVIPALSITFLTIISSLINLNEVTTLLLFVGVFTFVIFVQITFVGVIRSLRPSLL